MTIPLLPETAPFNNAQRAWLNGFLAGMLQIQPADTNGSGAQVVPSPVPDEDDMPWHDDTLSLDERLKLAEDRPVKDRLMASMAQMDCGACGYMCRTYADAIAEGAESDLSKCVPGAKETSKALKKIVKDASDQIGVSSSEVSLSVEGEKPGVLLSAYDRKNPFPSTLLAVTRLTSEKSKKDIRFVALDLAGSEISYEPGDSLGVYPRNCTKHVESLLETLGYTGNEPVRVPGGKLVPIREALEWYYTITNATELQANMLADCATDPKEAKSLRKLAEDDDALDMLDLWDLLLEYKSARPKPVDLVVALSPLQPRLYSISSSQDMFPDEVHLTIGVVRYELNGRPRRGVASTYFAERSNLGDRVRIFIQKAHNFALPEDTNAPVIMIGPGTGIAPFRSFLQHRKVNEHEGANWLFFGDQHRATDYLYEQELTQYQDEKILTKIDLAFSRDQEEKIYVQNRMLEKAEEIWEWLNRNAHIYLCGDASRMAKDVDQALRQIIMKCGQKSEEECGQFMKMLVETKRLQKDVY